MNTDLARTIEQASGIRLQGIATLESETPGEVYRAQTVDGKSIVIKTGSENDATAIEGWMLNYLARNTALPVPEVIYADDKLLLVSWIEAGHGITAPSQTHAAELLAALHSIGAEMYGLERDTVIGGLAQPNGQSKSWIEFFRDRRLLYMARQALDAGRIPDEMMARIELFAGRLSEWLEEPQQPALIHGDIWSGNVLVRDDRIAGFIDPAIYFADAEIELAFCTMFSTFTEPFFARYQEIRPIRPGFWETRREIYNLYPLLVHTRLFGGGYAHSVDATLFRFGV